MPITNPFYDYPDRFIPSQSSIALWMATRKKPNPGLPGLINTDSYASDQGWTLIALFIEILAAFATIYGGFRGKASGKMMALSIIVVLLFLFLDYIGIRMHRSKQEEKCKLKNNAEIVSDSALKRRLDLQAKNFNSIEVIGILLIILSAGLKLWGLRIFLGVGALAQSMNTLGLLLYLVVVYIHLNHTGYFIAAWIANRSVKKDFEKWSANLTGGVSSTVPSVLTFNFASVQELNQTQLNCGRQRLIKLNRSNGVTHYQLESDGLLWDQDLINISNLLTNYPFLKNDLIHAGIQLQLSTAGQLIGVSSNPLQVSENDTLMK
jgi:hypothetical protein